MQTYDIERFVTSTVRTLLPRNSPPEKALKIRLEYNLNVEDNGKVYNSCRILELIFHRPSNYTKVFSRVLTFHDEVLKDWEMKSNHDCSWVSDGLEDISNTYMEIREEMKQKTSNYDFNKHEVSIAPPLFGNYLEFVKIKLENNYKLVSAEQYKE